MELNHRQQRFISEYLIDLNGSRAVRAAGYSAKGDSVQATRLLANDRIRAEIEEKQAETAKKLEITREDVILGLRQAIEVAVAQGNPQAQIAGWREIGRILGLYAPESHKVGLSAADERFQKHLAQLPEREVLRLARGSGERGS